MHRVRATTIVTIIALTLCIIANVQADDAAVKKAVTSQYDKMNAAFKAKDVKGILDVVTTAFTVKRPDGATLKGDQLERALKAQFINTKSIKEWTHEITKLEVTADRVMVTWKSHMVAIVNKAGRYHTLDITQEGQDTWIKTPSGWRLNLEDVKRTTNLMDGKKI